MASEKKAPLSFMDTHKALYYKKISWKEYLHNLFLHCLPQWHVHDRFDEWQLMTADPFAYSVYRYHTAVTGVTDPAQLEEVFHTCEDGTLDDVKAKLAALTPYTASCLRASLAVLALRGKKLQLLKLCLEEPIPFWNKYPDRYFEDMANRVPKEDKELYEVIEKSKWRAGHPRETRNIYAILRGE